MTLEELRSEVEGRSPADEDELLAALLNSLPPRPYTVTDQDLDRRRDELRSGQVEDISFDELKRGLHLPPR